MSTGRPSGDEDDGQRDRRAEQDHQHGQDHGDQPAQAKAPAETRSREDYADEARAYGEPVPPGGDGVQASDLDGGRVELPAVNPPAVAWLSPATGKPTPMTCAVRPVARDLTAWTRRMTRPR